MQKAHIMNSREIKQIRKKLEEQWGFTEKLDYAFLMNEKNKIYIITKDLKMLKNPEDIRIDSLGLYFGELKNNEIRLSIEGSQIIGPKAKKNTIEISRPEMLQWFKGEDLKTEGKAPRYVIISHKNDYIGTGRLKEGKILNHVPKSRRLDYKYED